MPHRCVLFYHSSSLIALEYLSQAYLIRCYKAFLNHLCKVMVANIPRAQWRSRYVLCRHLCKVITADILSPQCRSQYALSSPLERSVMAGAVWCGL